MKNLRVTPSLLATLLVVSNVVAQTSAGPATDALSEPSGISAARNKYLERAGDAATTKDSQTEAQLPRRGRRVPVPPPRGYNRGSYSTPFANSDPGHALIGAGIGFAIGATIGGVAAASNGKSVGNTVFFGGAIFALFGAVIGGNHGSSHPFMYRRRTYPVWPEDDEEGHLRSPAAEKCPRAVLSASNKPALPSQPLGVEASTASPEMSPRPQQHSLDTAPHPMTQQ